MTTLDSFKLAAPEEKKEEESTTARDLAMGGAAALPFAGMIGERGRRHAGGPNVGFDELQKMMRKGDVVLNGNPEKGLAKTLISTATGAPDAHHVSVVRNPEGGWVSHATPNKGMVGEQLGSAHKLHVYRPTLNPQELEQFLGNVESAHDVQKKFQSGVQAHHDNLGLPAPGNIGGGTYDLKGSLKSGLRNIFMPKTVDPSTIEGERAGIQAARSKYIKNPGIDSSIETALEQAGTNGHSTFDVRNATPEQVAMNCSNMIAGSLPPGKSVLPNKHVSDILPDDIRKSPMFTHVGSYDPTPAVPRKSFIEAPVNPMSFSKPTSMAHAKAMVQSNLPKINVPKPGLDSFLKHAPTAMRAGTGLALAGGVYGAHKLYKHFTRDQKKQQHE